MFTRKFTVQLMALLALIAVLTACGGQEPLSLADIEATQIAQATEVSVEIEETIATRIVQYENIAPEGTVVDGELPERAHDDSLIFPTSGGLPPRGGAHNNVWQKCDVYDDPVKPEHAIHAMEHGAVWLTYDPAQLSEDDQATLIRQQKDPAVLISPYADQDAPIVLSAWGIQLSVDEVDDDRINEFMRRFLRGPQTPEPEANCRTGTTDTALDS